MLPLQIYQNNKYVKLALHSFNFFNGPYFLLAVIFQSVVYFICRICNLQLIMVWFVSN